jgi:hypothetical protein
MSLVALLAVIVIVGIILAIFDIDANMKKLAYVVVAVLVVLALLQLIGAFDGDAFRFGRIR